MHVSGLTHQINAAKLNSIFFSQGKINVTTKQNKLMQTSVKGNMQFPPIL